MKKLSVVLVLALDTLGFFPQDGFTFMENAVNTNGRQEKFPAESQYFFKGVVLLKNNFFKNALIIFSF